MASLVSYGVPLVMDELSEKVEKTTILTSEHAYESKTKPSGMWEYNLKTKMLESRAGISSDNEIKHVSYPAEKQSDITGKNTARSI